MAGPSRNVASAASDPSAPSPSIANDDNLRDTRPTQPHSRERTHGTPVREVIMVLGEANEALQPSRNVALVAPGSVAPVAPAVLAKSIPLRRSKRRKLGRGPQVDSELTSGGHSMAEGANRAGIGPPGTGGEGDGPQRPSSTHSAQSATERTVDIECWPMQCLVRGDGTKSRTGNELENGKFYGSAYTYSSVDSFHEIDISSLNVSSRGQNVVEWSYRALKKNRKLPDNIEKPISNLGERTTDVASHLRRAVVQWCTRFTGVVLIIGGPTSRGPIVDVERYFVRSYGGVFQRGRSGRCVFDCIVNAVDRVVGRDAAETAAAEVSQMATHFPSLTGVKDVLANLSAPVTARRMEVNFSDAFSWLAEDAKGVLIVRVGQCGVVDYCVVVDTYQALIYDSAEEFPMSLSAETLRKCGGDGANNLGVLQMRQIIKKEEALPKEEVRAKEEVPLPRRGTRREQVKGLVIG